MDSRFVDAARAAFPSSVPAVTLGAPLHGGEVLPEPLVRLPLATANRHGLIAGATGTGKTKSLQLLAEQLSKAGVPVFLADVKGDVSGIAVPGAEDDRVRTRARDTGWPWTAMASPVEFLSLSGRRGAQLRATVTSFGPLLLAKVLGLNETQTSVLTLVFEYCDKEGLELVDFTDLRAVLQHVSGPGAAELVKYGTLSKATVGVLQRKMVELEHQGALAFFGEPEFDLDDLLKTTPDGHGIVTVLELSDAQEQPALTSTFMMWMLARLYAQLPEVGDLEQPKLVFFFDEAQLLFEGSSKAFRDQVEKVVRLVRSKGVGVFFVTQNPRDLPADILAQLGNKVQHALRAYTPDDEAALRSAAKTFPKTPFYDVAETLQSLGIGEALVTVLAPNGVPTPSFATRMIPPASRMGPLTEDELRQQLERSAQVKEYAQAVDRESARERLEGRANRPVAASEPPPPAPPAAREEAGPGARLEEVLRSPLARTVAGAITRSLMGALVGPPRRRRRRY